MTKKPAIILTASVIMSGCAADDTQGARQLRLTDVDQWCKTIR